VLEQLQRDAEGELALSVLAAGAQHLHVRPLGARGGLGEQAGLAGAGVALD
jgi:hypothetical protein